MSEPANHRWALGVLVMRWRWLFLILPLLGILAAGWTVFVKNREANRVEALVEARVVNPEAAMPADRNGPEAFAKVLLSDAVLRQVWFNASLSCKWGCSMEEGITRLRGMIECQPLQNSWRLKVRVKGKWHPYSVLICESVVDEAIDESRRLRAPEEKRLEGKKFQELALWSLVKMDKESNLRKLGSHADYRDYQKAQREYEVADRKLTEVMDRKDLGDPPRLLKWPPAAPVKFTDTVLASARPLAMIMGAGMLLPMLVALLLERFFPRRAGASEIPVGES